MMPRLTPMTPVVLNGMPASPTAGPEELPVDETDEVSGAAELYEVGDDDDDEFDDDDEEESDDDDEE